MHKLKAAILILVVLGTHSLLLASRIFYQVVTLERVVGASQHIVIAVSAPVPRTEKEIPIDKRKKHPPFTLRIDHFVVVKVLYSQEGTLKAGDTIAVNEANWEQDLYIHRKYYLEGISKSPIVETYRPEEDAKTGKEGLILFLREGEDGKLAYAIRQGVESPAKEARIRAILQKKRSK